MKYFLFLSVFFHLISFSVKAQQVIVRGHVVNPAEEPIAGVSIYIEGKETRGTVSDSSGRYFLQVEIEEGVSLVFSHVEYQKVVLALSESNYSALTKKVVMEPDTLYLDELEIKSSEQEEREQVSITEIDPIDAKAIPSPFNEFSKVLSTLPGVVSNNELSSSYSVRGGNFDENLVYVNDIPIYRPFLVRSGQQEGLSFVNPDLVSDITFSSGGWPSKYGDKLSSSLNISYKVPKENSGSLTLGLLGGAAHASLYNEKRRLGILVGIRHKNSRYLLKTLETAGQYLPSFTDVQVFLSKELDKNGKLKVELLTSYARNRYFIRPESRVTTFGTLSQTMKLGIAFQGNELMEYDTYQSGLKLSHVFSKRFVADVILSGLYTLEREYYDIEGAYRLCDINNIAGSRQEECITIRGVGVNYQHARNNLKATIFNGESRNTFFINNNHTLEFGFGMSYEAIDDLFREYDFSDSSDFVTVNNAVDTQASLTSTRLTAYLQNTSTINEMHTLTYGVRLNYWDLNEQLLLSPRLQYALDPQWEKDFVFRAAVGIYQQPAFYRELRDSEGNLNKSIKAQSSFHTIAGFDYNLQIWGRNFKWVTEAYYKAMWNVIPYEVDNVRIRYSARNNARAYATGVDFRISGEFIEGAQSWFSLGILSTQEDVEGDDQGYIRRPSDQRVNVGIHFQDHIPNDPTIRMYLSLLFGSGLPFGPPDNDEYRNAFTGKPYRRVDIGFSKIFAFEEDTRLFVPKSLWISLEVLNLLGNNNVLSYTWIEDVNNQQFAVPNSLSARFLNLKVVSKF